MGYKTKQTQELNLAVASLQNRKDAIKESVVCVSGVVTTGVRGPVLYIFSDLHVAEMSAEMFGFSSLPKLMLDRNKVAMPHYRHRGRSKHLSAVTILRDVSYVAHFL